MEMKTDPKNPPIPESTTTLEILAWKALTKVYDPETRISLVDLGLIRDIEEFPTGHLTVVMTYTEPSCPLADYLQEAVYLKLVPAPGVMQVKIEVVMDPPWTPDWISEAGQKQMKLG